MLLERCVVKEFFTEENKSGFLRELCIGSYKNRLEAMYAIKRRIQHWLKTDPNCYEENYCVKHKFSNNVIEYEITYVTDVI